VRIVQLFVHVMRMLRDHGSEIIFGGTVAIPRIFFPFRDETRRDNEDKSLEKQLAYFSRVKVNHHVSGQQLVWRHRSFRFSLARFPLAAFDTAPYFYCDPCHHPGSSVCKKPMA
jgi:hypothetical protein